jgi:hypothetical protein
MNKNTKAEINLNNYQGKLLLLSANKDPFWPSKEMCEHIEKTARLT